MNCTKKTLSFAVCLLTLVSLARYVSAQEKLPEINIGIVFDGPWENNDYVRKLFVDECTALLQSEFNVKFPQDKTIVSDWTIENIRIAIDSLLADKNVDFLIGSGAIASQELSLRRSLPKPCIAPFIIDPLLQGTPEENGRSGIKNLSYIASPWRQTERIRTFREVVPFSKLVILASKPFTETIPQITNYRDQCYNDLGIDVELISVGYSIEEALNAIPPDADAVSVAPILHLGAEAFQKLIDGINEKKLPSYAVLGKIHVEKGLMVGILSDSFFPKVARRTALDIQRILLGEKPEDVPTVLPMNERLVINMETARKIGAYPNWTVLTEAELLNNKVNDIDRVVTLQSAVDDALKVNLELLAKKFETDAGAENGKQAVANLLPQIEISALGTIIDKDLAESSFGTQAERTLSASANLQQIIFSEKALANVSIQKNLQLAREYDEEKLKLDIIQAAATAYLNVLITKTLERIEKENLEQTRDNLELAQVREALGISGTAEVLRWQGRLSSNRSSVINSNATRNKSELQLNRLLDRPLEENFLTAEIDINSPTLLSSDERFFDAMKNPWTFRLMRTFMEEEGLRSTPELKQLDAAIAAQNRLYVSSGRQFWMPTIALQGELKDVLDEGGVGTSSSLAGFLPPGVSVGSPDGATWTLGVKASLPIFKGGSRVSERRQARQSLEQLRMERAAIADKIAQRIRSALHDAGASYASIALSRDAAEAADSTLDLVVDAYSRGAATVIDLIDAQNNALVAEQAAAIAVYSFLVDLLEAERSIGKFDFMRDEQERADFFNRMSEFIAAGDNKGNN